MTRVRCHLCGKPLRAINNAAIVCPNCDLIDDDTEDE